MKIIDETGVSRPEWRSRRAIRFNKNEGSGGIHGRPVWRSNTL